MQKLGLMTRWISWRKLREPLGSSKMPVLFKQNVRRHIPKTATQTIRGLRYRRPYCKRQSAATGRFNGHPRKSVFYLVTLRCYMQYCGWVPDPCFFFFLVNLSYTEPANNGNLSLAENFLAFPGIWSLEDPDFKYLVFNGTCLKRKKNRSCCFRYWQVSLKFMNYFVVSCAQRG